MNFIDILYKKREGQKLTKEEIAFFVSGYVNGTIPDYQASAFLMAIYFQGMDDEETFNLTEEMRYSGDVMDLSAIDGIKVDKHSTGGVGDKTTLIIGPMVASCGVPVAKLSGRGLGFTGGTVDKMESIPGFRTALEPEEFVKQVNAIGMSVIGQTAHIAKADKKIYALRDVTCTVENLSLIASSIMSKKLASGSDAILLDVKCGGGAFMKNLDAAKELGSIMTRLGNDAGKKTVAVISDMNQPLGKAVGNSLEVIEAIEVLKGNGPADITELAVTLSSIMLHLGGMVSSVEDGRAMALDSIKSGRALEKMKDFIKWQGGNPQVCDDYSLFPETTVEVEISSKVKGYVQSIDAMGIGQASQHTGAGRLKKEDEIDLGAGIYLNKKVGDKVEIGETIFTVYGNDENKVKMAVDEANKAYVISDEETEKEDLIKAILK